MRPRQGTTYLVYFDTAGHAGRLFQAWADPAVMSLVDRASRPSNFLCETAYGGLGCPGKSGRTRTSRGRAPSAGVTIPSRSICSTILAERLYPILSRR